MDDPRPRRMELTDRSEIDRKDATTMKSKHDIWYRFGYENPARPPDRRHRLAKACLENGIRPSSREDNAIWVIFRYLQRRDAALTGEDRAKLRQEYRDLMDAYRLKSGKLSRMRPVVQAYILAGEPDDSLGMKVGLHANVIRWFRTAFFDIEHLRNSPIRIVRDVIGIDEESEKVALEGRRFSQLIGYLLKSKALDCLFCAGPYSAARTDEDVLAWTSRRTRVIAGLKQLTAAHALDVRHHGQLQQLSLLIASFDRIDQESENRSKTISEQHIQAMLDDIAWMMGTDAEDLLKGTLLGEADTWAAELRDDEIHGVSVGKGVSDIDEKKMLKIPPPRRRPAGLDGQFGIPREPK